MTNKKKKAPSKWLIRLLVALLGVGILANAYYLLQQILPDHLLDPSFGLSVLGRDFSVFVIVYDVLMATALVMGAYYSLQLYKEKYMTVRQKKSSTKGKVVVGSMSSHSKQRWSLYQAGSIVVIALLIGVLGAATSQPSSAQSISTSKLKMRNTSYTKMSEARSPTGTLRYSNAVNNLAGGVIDTMQGGTTDGTYLYFAYGSPVAGVVIAKYDLQGKLVKFSQVYSLEQIGHANGMTYDSHNNRLVMTVYHYEGATIINGEKLAFVDPETLEITGYVSTQSQEAIKTVCYNAATDQYVSNGMLFDANFNLLNTNLYDYSLPVLKPYGDLKSVGQGITCTSSNIYVLRYYGNKTKPHTHIYMYDWSGKLVAVYNVSGLKDEGENLYVLSGKLYLGVNNGSTYLGKSSDNKKDYFVRLKSVPVTDNPATPGIPTN